MRAAKTIQQQVNMSSQAPKFIVALLQRPGIMQKWNLLQWCNTYSISSKPLIRPIAATGTKIYLKFWPKQRESTQQWLTPFWLWKTFKTFFTMWKQLILRYFFRTIKQCRHSAHSLQQYFPHHHQRHVDCRTIMLGTGLTSNSKWCEFPIAMFLAEARKAPHFNKIQTVSGVWNNKYVARVWNIKWVRHFPI